MNVGRACLPLLLALAMELPGAPVEGLSITVLRGEGSFNDIKRKPASELVVQIQDEAERPVSGAQVSFTAPYTGAGGWFGENERTRLVRSDADGRAAASGFRPNSAEGRFAIRVTAWYEGKTASTLIWQSNTLASGQKGGGQRKWLVLGLAGGAIAGGVALAAGRNSGSTAAAAPAATSLSLGTLTVGAPH